MTLPGETLWTIDELGARVAEALSAADQAAGKMNGRVREVPDLRTIRYYTTLGLIDRPAEMRGRTALYGRRHLLQLVAIKRLQSRGLSLADVQRELLGRTDADLERIGGAGGGPYIAPGLPGVDAVGDQFADTGMAPKAASAPSAPDRADFWKSAPADSESFWSKESAAPDDSGRRQSEVQSQPAAAMQGIPLAEDVVLLLTTARTLGRGDLEALAAAAGPLLKVLRSRRLVGGG